MIYDGFSLGLVGPRGGGNKCPRAQAQPNHIINGSALAEKYDFAQQWHWQHLRGSTGSATTINKGTPTTHPKTNKPGKAQSLFGRGPILLI